MAVDILEFDLGGESYAMDIQIAREIVEMLPITPIPRAPAHVTGLLNLRGEITTIINIHHHLGITPSMERDMQKIMVLLPEAFDNTSVGIIVDEVHSVLTIEESDIDTNIKGVDSDLTDFVQGIIKLSSDNSSLIETGDDSEDTQKRLVIWLDVRKILMETVEKSSVKAE